MTKILDIYKNLCISIYTLIESTSNSNFAINELNTHKKLQELKNAIIHYNQINSTPFDNNLLRDKHYSIFYLFLLITENYSSYQNSIFYNDKDNDINLIELKQLIPNQIKTINHYEIHHSFLDNNRNQYLYSDLIYHFSSFSLEKDYLKIKNDNLQNLNIEEKIYGLNISNQQKLSIFQELNLNKKNNIYYTLLSLNNNTNNPNFSNKLLEEFFSLNSISFINEELNKIPSILKEILLNNSNYFDLFLNKFDNYLFNNVYEFNSQIFLNSLINEKISDSAKEICYKYSIKQIENNQIKQIPLNNIVQYLFEKHNNNDISLYIKDVIILINKLETNKQNDKIINSLIEKIPELNGKLFEINEHYSSIYDFIVDINQKESTNNKFISSHILVLLFKVELNNQKYIFNKFHSVSENFNIPILIQNLSKQNPPLHIQNLVNAYTKNFNYLKTISNLINHPKYSYRNNGKTIFSYKKISKPLIIKKESYFKEYELLENNIFNIDNFGIDNAVKNKILYTFSLLKESLKALNQQPKLSTENKINVYHSIKQLHTNIDLYLNNYKVNSLLKNNDNLLNLNTEMIKNLDLINIIYSNILNEYSDINIKNLKIHNKILKKFN